MQKKSYNLKDELLTKMDQDAKERNIKYMNDYVTQALEHFLVCKKLESSASMKMIVLKWPAHCVKCTDHHLIEAGEWALYGRGVGAICLEAYIQRLGDKPLLAKFLKMREYQQIIKALKKEADRLATKVESGRIQENIEKLHKLTSEMHHEILKYLREKIGTPQEKEQLDKALTASKNVFEFLENLRLWLERTLLKKKKAKELYA